MAKIIQFGWSGVSEEQIRAAVAAVGPDERKAAQWLLEKLEAECKAAAPAEAACKARVRAALSQQACETELAFDRIQHLGIEGVTEQQIRAAVALQGPDVTQAAEWLFQQRDIERKAQQGAQVAAAVEQIKDLRAKLGLHRVTEEQILAAVAAEGPDVKRAAAWLLQKQDAEVAAVVTQIKEKMSELGLGSVTEEQARAAVSAVGPNEKLAVRWLLDQ